MHAVVVKIIKSSADVAYSAVEFTRIINHVDVKVFYVIEML